MAQIELGPGVPGKFSEPKWSESRKTYQVHCLVGELLGEPTKVHGSGKSKPKAIANLKKRVAAWKPKVQTVGQYSQNVSVETLSRAWLAAYEKNKSKRPQNSKHYRREIEPATKGRGKKDKGHDSRLCAGQDESGRCPTLPRSDHLEQMLGTSYKISWQRDDLRIGE